MNDKQALKQRIWELDFALHELTLYLDTHPSCMKGLALVREYRRQREAALIAYENKFGKLVNDVKDVEPNGSWGWIKGPWPWEKSFAEE